MLTGPLESSVCAAGRSSASAPGRTDTSSSSIDSLSAAWNERLKRSAWLSSVTPAVRRFCAWVICGLASISSNKCARRVFRCSSWRWAKKASVPVIRVRTWRSTSERAAASSESGELAGIKLIARIISDYCFSICLPRDSHVQGGPKCGLFGLDSARCVVKPTRLGARQHALQRTGHCCLETALDRCTCKQGQMNTDLSGFDAPLHLCDHATHPITPHWRVLAALLLLAAMHRPRRRALPAHSGAPERVQCAR